MSAHPIMCVNTHIMGVLSRQGLFLPKICVIAHKFANEAPLWCHPHAIMCERT